MKCIHLLKRHDETGCGAACLSMMFQHFGRKLTMARALIRKPQILFKKGQRYASLWEKQIGSVA